MKLILLVLALLLTGCGYDGTIRYSCQEPDNWSSKECQSPYCDVTGTCPRDLVPHLFESEDDGKAN
jgi:hypothetical protein